MKNYKLTESYIEAADTASLNALVDSLKFDEILSLLEKLSDDRKVVVFEVLY